MEREVIEGTRVYFTSDEYRSLPRIIQREFSNAEQIGVTTAGEEVRRIAEERILQALESLGYRVELLPAEELNARSFTRKPDLILGVGGGRGMDLGKEMAVQYACPVVTVPTSPSTDAPASNRSAFRGPSKPATEPALVVCDLKIIGNAPPSLFLDGLGEMLGKVTSTLDWRIGKAIDKEPFNEKAHELCYKAFEFAYENSRAIAKRQRVKETMRNLIACGVAMKLANSSRPASGPEHNFAHVLHEFGLSLPHGRSVAVGTLLTLPYVSVLRQMDSEFLESANGKYELITPREFLNIFESLNFSLRELINGLRRDLEELLRTGEEFRPERFKIAKALKSKGAVSYRREVVKIIDELTS